MTKDMAERDQRGGGSPPSGVGQNSVYMTPDYKIPKTALPLWLSVFLMTSGIILGLIAVIYIAVTILKLIGI